MSAKRTVIVLSVVMIGIWGAIDASAQVVDDVDSPGPTEPLEGCTVYEKATVCDFPVIGECTEMDLCMDAVIMGSSAGDGAGGNVILGGPLDELTGYYDEDAANILIGSLFQKEGSTWVPDPAGRLATCKWGVSQPTEFETDFTSVTSPLLIHQLGPYSDRAGTVSVVIPCTSTKAIGPWSYLQQYASTRLQIYTCGDMDFLYGTPNLDVFWAGSGSDTVYAGGGGDTICGDNYSDPRLDCESGYECDPLDGGPDGDDVLWGEAGNDFVHGDHGNDFIHGGVDGDDLYGNEGSDHLWLRRQRLDHGR